MVQITVLKVNFTCDKDRKKLFQAVSGVRGVDRVEIDVNKGTLIVTGNADPYEIILRTQKAGRFVEVMSVGPPPAPPKPSNEPKKPDDINKKPPDQKPQVQAQPQAQSKAQPQTNTPLAPPQAQPLAQLQFNAHLPTQAQSHIHNQAQSQIHNPYSCLICQHMYMYQSPVWTSPVSHWQMGGNNYF